MDIPQVTATDQFLLSVDWGAILQRLTAYAGSRFREGTREDWEDIANSAVERLLDPAYRPWSPAVPSMESLLRHLQSEVNGLISNRRKLRQRRGATLPFEETDGGGAQKPFEAMEWSYALLEQLDGKSDACEVFCRILDGAWKPSDTAEALQWPATRVYEARRVIKENAEIIRGNRP